MKDYPISKYTFYKTKNKIIAVSTYAGKTVKGVAKCHPDDTFDEAKGREIAAARCNLAVAKKRFKRASQKYSEAHAIWRKALANEIKADNYYQDACCALEDAQRRLNDVCI